MYKEPFVTKDSMVSVRSSKNKLQEEYQIKKKEYIQKYGYVNKDPIDESNWFSNFFYFGHIEY